MGDQQNLSQRIAIAALNFERGGDLREFLAEVVVCICDLDVRTASLDNPDTMSREEE